MVKYTLSVVIEKDRFGYYAQCPALQGCYSQALTYEELMRKMRDACALHLRDRLDHGEEIFVPEMVSVATVEVAA
jgi:predicted RNase H-like HicB family nuclease